MLECYEEVYEEDDVKVEDVEQEIKKETEDGNERLILIYNWYYTINNILSTSNWYQLINKSFKYMIGIIL